MFTWQMGLFPCLCMSAFPYHWRGDKLVTWGVSRYSGERFYVVPTLSWCCLSFHCLFIKKCSCDFFYFPSPLNREDWVISRPSLWKTRFNLLSYSKAFEIVRNLKKWSGSSTLPPWTNTRKSPMGVQVAVRGPTFFSCFILCSLHFVRYARCGGVSHCWVLWRALENAVTPTFPQRHS